MPDIFGIYVAKIPNTLHMHIINLLDPSSDHSPVMVLLDCLPPNKINASPTQSKTDWVKFRAMLDVKTNLTVRFKSTKDIDDAVNLFTTNIGPSFWKSAVPTKLALLQFIQRSYRTCSYSYSTKTSSSCCMEKFQIFNWQFVIITFCHKNLNACWLITNLNFIQIIHIFCHKNMASYGRQPGDCYAFITHLLSYAMLMVA